LEVTDALFGTFTTSYLLAQLEYMLRIVTAGFLGFLIGHERKNQNKPAGVRTHAIVALGSALIMVVSKYGFSDMAVQSDGTRIAAQVVSGVGFLGAGVIFVRNNLVNGLTTAAGVWATAGVGLALGAGQYIVGIMTSVLIIGIQMMTHKITYFSQAAYSGCLNITVAEDPSAINRMEDFLKDENHVEIVSIRTEKTKSGKIRMQFEVIYPSGFDKGMLLTRLAELEDVMEVSE